MKYEINRGIQTCNFDRKNHNFEPCNFASVKAGTPKFRFAPYSKIYSRTVQKLQADAADFVIWGKP